MHVARKLLVPLLALAALLLVIAWMAGMFRDKVEPGLQTLAADADASDTTPVRVETQPLIEPVPATIRAKEATIVSARILARIDKIHVRAGDTVEHGDLLVELEQADLAARAAQAERQADAVAARLEEARKQLARITEMHERGVVAAAELDRARANFDSIQAELQRARQAHREAVTALGFASIEAPIAGRIVDRFAEPGDTATPGMKLLSIYNPLSLRIEAQVREQLALGLEVGQELAAEIPSLERTVTARIEELVPAADPGARTFGVKAGIDYDEKLLPGMFARLLIPAGAIERLLIPAERVVQVGQLDVVWVLSDGRAERRLVRLGPQAEGEVAVLAGLAPGEQILLPPRELPGDE